MGLTKRGSASVGVGCGLVVAAAVAFATWPVGAVGGGGPCRPAAVSAGFALPGSAAASADARDATVHDGSDDGSDDDRDDSSADDGGEERIARTSDGLAFELEIDPELDARFGPRPVNGVQAAEIAVERFGGRAVAVELDEEGGRPIWEGERAGAAVDEVDVDAIDGRIR